ncbi:hypothetical protein GCK32_021369 [Trichostrongylus colubriformis]|uniref:Uncharacterized protein n=1 Tax=Trichostrongylus colubriformis TaxID=6319 RepID=A0AAN8FHD5_TRICO
MLSIQNLLLCQYVINKILLLFYRAVRKYVVPWGKKESCFQRTKFVSCFLKGISSRCLHPLLRSRDARFLHISTFSNTLTETRIFTSVATCSTKPPRAMTQYFTCTTRLSSTFGKYIGKTYR